MNDTTNEFKAFTAQARIYKLVAIVGGFVAGLFFLPMMAEWDGYRGSMMEEFHPVNSTGWLLIGLFILAGIMSSAIAFLIVRNWEMSYAPEGYDTDQVW